MSITLNFSDKEIKKVLKVLEQFTPMQLTSEYMLARAKAGASVVTLYTSGKLLIQGGAEEQVRDKILKELKLDEELVLGIDETGRGEGFGPLVVVGVLADRNKMREMRDSKKIAKKKLEEKVKLVKGKALAVKSVKLSAKEIDKLRGSGETMNSIQAKAIDEIVKAVRALDLNFNVKVDGGRLPVKIKSVQFIPKGDDKEPVIGAASIVAKWEREHSKDKAVRKSWKSAKK